MQMRNDATARRMVRLIIIIGIVIVSLAIINSVITPEAGLTLPIAKTALDNGWLLILGLLWLIIGLILLWWLRPAAANAAETGTLQSQEVDLTALTHRIAKLEQQMSAPTTPNQGQSLPKPVADEMNSRVHELDKELDNLATAIQDVQRRLDTLHDVDNRVDELESQLDSLYVTVQDTHRRIDLLEESDKH